MGISIVATKYCGDFISLCYNNDWSRHAKDILREVSASGKDEEFMELLSERFGEAVADNEIEEFFYFEDEWIRKELGLDTENEEGK